MIVRELAERAYFVLCLVLGRLLRSGSYAKARIVYQDGELRIGPKSADKIIAARRETKLRDLEQLKALGVTTGWAAP
jgi:hypothetical protein